MFQTGHKKKQAQQTEPKHDIISERMNVEDILFVKETEIDFKSIGTATVSETSSTLQTSDLKKKKSPTYEFITKAGPKFKSAILKLCGRFISKETFPTRFNLTTLIQLPKKGSAQLLDNKRFIHIKDWLARLVEALTVEPMKAKIFEAGTKFQIGGCPGMRTVFHLFVVKSNIIMKLKSGQGVIMTFLDLIKFFDKQSLIDACDALFNAEVNPKLFRCWYQLNKSTEIEVRTGAGDSARGLAGPVTGQGGGGAAMASALNLDRGVERYFCDSTDEDCYGTIRLQPLIYIDDLARSSTDLNSVRNGNMKFSSLAMEKQLQFHPKKSSFLVYGTENFRARIRLEANEEQTYFMRRLKRNIFGMCSAVEDSQPQSRRQSRTELLRLKAQYMN